MDETRMDQSTGKLAQKRKKTWISMWQRGNLLVCLCNAFCGDGNGEWRSQEKQSWILDRGTWREKISTIVISETVQHQVMCYEVNAPVLSREDVLPLNKTC